VTRGPNSPITWWLTRSDWSERLFRQRGAQADARYPKWPNLHGTVWVLSSEIVPCEVVDQSTVGGRWHSVTRSDQRGGMVSDSTVCDVEIVELSEAEAADAFDQVAHREMGISGAEFLRRWDAGEWTEKDLDDVDGLVEVWMSLPLVR
jgi:hypothetical protein